MELTYREELERKTLETVETLALRHEQGVLTNKQFRVAMDAVWGCTSGLVDQIGELMSDVVTLEPERESVTVSNGKQVFLIGRNKTVVTITDCLTMKEGKLTVFHLELEAVEHVRKLTSAFRTKGFTVL